MLFATILVSFLLIGSTIAQNDIQRMESLRQVSYQCGIYIQNLANIYNGFQALTQKEVYRAFQAQDGIMQLAINQMQQNEKSPQKPVRVTKSAAEVKTGWTTATLAVINECISNIETNAASRDDLAEVLREVSRTTSSLMDIINISRLIIDEHKKKNCPIFDRLLEIIKNCATTEEYSNFRSKNGA